jgi:hypothetical protein
MEQNGLATEWLPRVAPDFADDSRPFANLAFAPLGSSNWAKLIGRILMTSLADLLDPDQWIVSGKSLLDFPWPEGNNEREAMNLILSTRPLLQSHVARWSKRVMEALGRRGGEKVGDVFAEEYLRELWERSRAPS